MKIRTWVTADNCSNSVITDNGHVTYYSYKISKKKKGILICLIHGRTMQKPHFDLFSIHLSNIFFSNSAL